MESKDTILKSEEHGSIHIAEEVVVSIASLAVSEVAGVASLASGSGVAGVAEFLSKKASRGIKITMDGKSVNLDVSILIQYGCQVTDVAQKVQEKVKSAVETMAGLEVSYVNVHVTGVAFDKPSKK